jgi:polar amino acid transport system permease protein
MGPPGDAQRRSAARALLDEEGARGALVAVASTVAFLSVAVVLVATSDNWPKVRSQFFSVDDLRAVFPSVRKGFLLDLRMFLFAAPAVVIVSLVVAVLRSLRGPVFFPLRLMCVVYIDVFRGIPLYLVILLLGFGVPALDIGGVPRGAMFWGVTAMVLSYSAYTAEVFRAGIDSVHDSQRSAARALGLTQWQSLRFAVLPQAVRNVIPALLSTLVSLQKDVALIGVLGIREAVKAADVYKGRTFNYTGYIAAAFLFILISVPLARFADWYTARERARRSQALA